ncbi:MAG: Asp-tRNA(Asn)/Glu-tRNA(Gln) amidotransferase subunit GatA [Acidobacteria bacterium]|nr:Asp-tRNA(Asn)/Glu-tRNA(Gln) amidotransferase subunit GatA [Acidobacteriota bacterium]
MKELLENDAATLREKIRSRSVSAEEVCRAFLDRIEAVEERIHAFCTLQPEKAIETARAIDAKISRGETVGPLAGVPVAVKDVICTRDLRTTCSSRILENFVPTFDATVVRKLREADAVIVGKTNMDEFAMGSSTENSAFHSTRNPWDLDRVPGGSSGGSAAILAAGGIPIALGTDTGGSIRQPAAFCGIVGLKPTYGRVSRYGQIAFASSLDQIGPMGRTVTDCALLLNQIAGPDPKDSTCSTDPAGDYLERLQEPVRGLRVGVPEEYFPEGLDPEIKATILTALEHLEKMGVIQERISLPHTDYAVPAYYVIAPAEASSNLARYDGVRYGARRESTGANLVQMYRATRTAGFGKEVKCRIMLGTYVLSAGYYDAYYLKAQKVRTRIRIDFDEAFEKVDFILSPTTPTTAFLIGEKLESPLEMYLSYIFTATSNLAGLPSLSLPGGLSSDGLPIGIQLIGKPFEEETLLKTAFGLEQALRFRDTRPLLPIDH